ncbi:MAG: hypothetical protein QXI39_09060 [Candidatus Bathyarchaeia archaeon]
MSSVPHVILRFEDGIAGRTTLISLLVSLTSSSNPQISGRVEGGVGSLRGLLGST